MPRKPVGTFDANTTLSTNSGLDPLSAAGLDAVDLGTSYSLELQCVGALGLKTKTYTQ